MDWTKLLGVSKSDSLSLELLGNKVNFHISPLKAWRSFSRLFPSVTEDEKTCNTSADVRHTSHFLHSSSSHSHLFLSLSSCFSSDRRSLLPPPLVRSHYHISLSPRRAAHIISHFLFFFPRFSFRGCSNILQSVVCEAALLPS